MYALAEARKVQGSSPHNKCLHESLEDIIIFILWYHYIGIKFSYEL